MSTLLYLLQKPGIPCVVDKVKLDYACLSWEPPRQVLKNMNYQLRYKEACSDSKWILSPCISTKPTIKLVNLKSNTRFVFQERMVSDEQVGPYSDSSDIVENIQSAASRLLDFMYEIKREDVEMPLKRLPMQETKKVRDLTGQGNFLSVSNNYWSKCRCFYKELFQEIIDVLFTVYVTYFKNLFLCFLLLSASLVVFFKLFFITDFGIICAFTHSFKYIDKD